MPEGCRVDHRARAWSGAVNGDGRMTWSTSRTSVLGRGAPRVAAGRPRGRAARPGRPAAWPSTRRRGTGAAGRCEGATRSRVPASAVTRPRVDADLTPSASLPATANRASGLESRHLRVERRRPAGDPLLDPESRSRWRAAGRTVRSIDTDDAAGDQPRRPALDIDELREHVGRRAGDERPRVSRSMAIRRGPRDGAGTTVRGPGSRPGVP